MAADHQHPPAAASASPESDLTPQISQHDSPLLSKEKDLGDQLGDAHLNILPRNKLLVCLSALSVGLFLTFCDQTGITVALSRIAEDLDAETTINWAGSAALLANCVCQVLFGRLADIFGRKNILLGSLGILAVSDLCIGFVKTGPQFYVFRAFAGIGCGGTQSLTMVMLSDICTLKQRGKYQGILGAQVGLGNALGPFIMAAFVEHNNWRNFYHMMPPIIVGAMVIIYFCIDNKMNAQQLNSVLKRSEKFKKIDYLGMLFSTAALTLILVPISGGGSTYAWNSVIVIVMFVVGGLCMITFVVIEMNIPKLPMIPINLFSRISLAIILWSNFFFGFAYYAFLYYVPYYFQIVRRLDAIHSSVLLLPLVLPQSIFSIIAGQIITYTGHYGHITIVGYSLWTLSCGLLLLFNEHTNYGVIVVTLLIMGSGVGFIFQPTMVAAQAHSKKSERAVVISARNVLRSFGGSFGIACGSLIVSNTLLLEIKQQAADPELVLPPSFLNFLKTHIYNKIDTSVLNGVQVVVVKGMYMKALHNFFIVTIPMLGLCLIGNLFVRDRGLQCIDEIAVSDDKVSDKENQ